MDRDSITQPSFDPTTTSLDAINTALASGQTSVEARATDYETARHAYEARVAEAGSRLSDESARDEYVETERAALAEADRALRDASRQTVADAQAVVRALSTDRVQLTSDEQRQAGERSTFVASLCEHFPVEQLAAQMAEAIASNDRPAMSLFLTHAHRIPSAIPPGTRDGSGRVLFGEDSSQASGRGALGPLLSQMRTRLRDSRQEPTAKQALAVLQAVRNAERPVVVAERERAEREPTYSFQQPGDVSW